MLKVTIETDFVTATVSDNQPYEGTIEQAVLAVRGALLAVGFHEATVGSWIECP